MTQAMSTGAGDVEQHSNVLNACSGHFLCTVVVSFSRQELPVAVGAPQELGVDILWMHSLCSQGQIWDFVPDCSLNTKLARSHRADCSTSSLALGYCKYVGYMSQLLLLPLHHEPLWCKEMHFIDRLLPIHHHWFKSLLSEKIDNLQLRKI